MSATDTKANLILNHEEVFAKSLAIKVIEKPKLSIWMILIPIIFLYFIYRMKKFKSGKEEFASHYLVSRKQALSTALEYIQGDRNASIDAVIRQINLNDKEKKCYREVLSLLFDHYVSLLTRGGDSYDDLVRSYYKTLDKYMNYVQHLNDAENTLNRCFADKDENADVVGVIDSIAEHSNRLRSDRARKIFEQS